MLGLYGCTYATTVTTTITTSTTVVLLDWCLILPATLWRLFASWTIASSPAWPCEKTFNTNMHKHQQCYKLGIVQKM